MITFHVLLVTIPISSLTNYEVISTNPIPDSIRKLEVITCDICRTASASHDVFVNGIEGVAFLKRCCNACAKNFT